MSEGEGRTMTREWKLDCSACATERDAGGLPGVCDSCGAPYLVRLAALPPVGVREELRARAWTMWRYREWLPLADDEAPVSLGEGGPHQRPARLDRDLPQHVMANIIRVSVEFPWWLSSASRPQLGP